MPSFKEGCVVVHRPTSLICKVIRWDREDKLLLVRPIILPSASGATSTKPRKRTRWVFEKAVVLVERTKKSGSRTATTATTTASTESSASASGGSPGRAMPPPATDSDLTEHARRSAKLDRRVEIREDRDHPERGRGLFAVQRVPEGTEVMRVRAVGAAVVRPVKEDLCGRCFRRANHCGVLTKCRNCLVPLCVACHSGGSGDRPHSTTCEFARICLMLPANPLVDEGTLRLSADILARKKAGEIDDKDWDLLNSLESHNNKAGSIGLGARELQISVQSFKDAMDMDVSEEDVQTMYRRVRRNVHMVSPDKDIEVCGDVQALFPFAALVNHSCGPNSCFHAVTTSSPRGPEVEIVLRTTFEVRKGDELCVSYFPAFIELRVVRRREMLEGWGFQCACARCQAEAEEEKHPEKHVKPRNRDTLKMLVKMNKIITLAAGEKLQFGQKEQDALTTALKLLGSTGQQDISPMLRNCLSMEAAAVVLVAEGKSDLHGDLSAYTHAAHVLLGFRDPRMVNILYNKHVVASKLLTAEKNRAKMHMLNVIAADALAMAVEMCELCYGKQNVLSVRLRRLASK